MFLRILQALQKAFIRSIRVVPVVLLLHMNYILCFLCSLAVWIRSWRLLNEFVAMCCLWLCRCMDAG